MPPISFPSTVGLDFEWLEPGPAAINFQLVAMEEYFESTELLAEQAKEAAQVDMARHFQTETDPDGHPWTALVQPSPFQQGILQLTGEMRDVSISDEPWTATPVGVFFNTGVLPDYWRYHEQPEGGGQRIPQRRFIGLSSDAEGEIERLGDVWLMEGINLGTRGFQRVGRAPAGRFFSFG
jgi:hypothetical protein